MLECLGLSVSYGPHRALEDATLQVAPGEIVVILGANGAGKSTLLKAIAGLVPASDASQIKMNGKSIRGLPPHRIVEAGVALVPEGRALFGELTVAENLLLGAYARRARDSEAEHLQSVLELFPILAERRGQTAHTMSGGEQQMVAIGRAIMSAPAILMLDEPSLGLSPLLCKELFKAFGEIRDTGVGILLVEQNAHLGLAIADRGYVLETGRIVAEDAAERLARDPAVREAYLGGAGESGPETSRVIPAKQPPTLSPVTTAATAPTATTVPTATTFPAAIPMAPGSPAGMGGGPRGETRTGELVSGTIAEMAGRASAIQARHIENVRSARPKAQPDARPKAQPGIPPDAPPGAAPSNAQPPNTQSLAEMVERATAIQAGHIESLRPARPKARPFASGPGRAGSALEEALANIEAAANKASGTGAHGTHGTHGAGGASRDPAHTGHPRDGGETTGLDQNGAPEDLPVIEVYKKPKLEIYRRSGAGKALELIKGE